MERNSHSENEQRMATENIRGLVLKYSIPPIIGMLVNALYVVADRFWIGRIPDIGRDALTGIGLCMPAINVGLGISMLLGIGAATTISIRLGQGDRSGAEHILGNTLGLVVILSLCVTAVGLLFADSILIALGADEKILPYAFEYYVITTGGYIFSMASFAMNHPIRAAGNTKRFASSQLIGGISNLILDPIFIFTFGLGICGAAIATIAAHTLSALWVFSYYFSDQSPLRIRRRYLKPVKKVVLAIFSIGLSPFLMQAAGSFVIMIANHSLKFYGDIELSDGNIAIGAMTIILGISMIFFMPLFGISQGCQPIIGYNYGAGNYDRVRKAYKWSMIYSTVICTIGFIITQFFSVQLISAFNDDPELIAIGSLGMRIFMSCMILIGLQVPSINFFQSIGQAKAAIVLSLLRQIVVLIPAYLLLPQFFGLIGIWLSGPLSDTIAFVITIYLVYINIKYLGKEKLAQ